MATEIAKAYVQILPSTEGFKSKLTTALGGDAASAGKSAGESCGSNFGENLVKNITRIIAAAGIGKVLKDALDAGGALQQSFGGIDTLYTNTTKTLAEFREESGLTGQRLTEAYTAFQTQATDAMKAYAREAANMGISMNDYAEQAVSFGAALKSAYGGDVVEAAKAADVAIRDMADNSAKMGTDIGSIQNAYQGFAKQNYTMLDNLKLGYGGTKEEMQRLLKDAEKLSGVKYDMSNLGDVYNAIHVIQEDLGLTGVAAEEASTTFTGSFGAMKAAATNFLADLTTGGDVSSSLSTLITNTGTFLFNNLIPMLRDLISSLPEVISQIVTADGPAFIEQGMGLITELKYGVISALDTLATDLIPNFLDMGINFINSLAEGMSGNVTNMLSEFLPRLLEFTTMLREKAGSFVDAGINLIMNIAQGLIDGLPVMIENIPTIVSNIAGIINDNAPKLLVTAGNLIIALVKGLIQSIPVIIANMPKIIGAIVDVISAFNWMALGGKIMTFFKNGIVSLTSNIGTSMSEIVSNMVSKVTSFDWSNLGKYIIEGILAGLKAAAQALLNFIIDLCASMLSTIKKFFGIESPSKLMRDEVGKWIPAGIAVGIETNTKAVDEAMDYLAADTLAVAKFDFGDGNSSSQNEQASGTVINQTLNVTTTDNSPDEIARAIRLESRYGLMVGGALG